MASRKISEQLPLAFTHAASTGRDDLLVSGALEAAATIVDRWPDWPSPVVVLIGPPGSGKSHLAAIWQETSGAVTIEAREGDGASLTAASVPVLLEDADTAGFDERELFHVINSVRQHGTALLVTARTPPSAWGVALADLASRFKAATLVEIGAPDEALLSQVIVKLFADRQLAVDDRLVAYLVARMERSLDTARRVVEAMDRLALSRGVKLSRALAREVLDAVDGRRSDDEDDDDTAERA
ncbi:dnaA protein [Rhizobium sp. RU20A]|uniref:DnaA regulatory inactivator HdaA n=1 Tax=Rhizobium sp. RU20A TaxID=1907412 RepID=UPI000956B665|nr:DnaA regulatory inactivator HdaA [Rhizobium sp. RU20A]SIP94574.1 dnaA protein [Rhizobium sp. RU20A]